jgi:hypothetical protein
MRAPLALTLIVLLSGCASQGLHADALRQVLADDASRFMGGPAQGELPAHPGGSAGKTLGLYVAPTGYLRHGFEWTDRDRETVLEWATRRSQTGVAQDASFISLASLKGQTLAHLRESAARYRADKLLVIEGAAMVDRYSNYKGRLLYWTILGAYFADGTHSDALCIVRGTLWDVRTGARLASEEAEGQAATIGPTALLDDHDVIRQAKRQALESLLAKLAVHAERP